MFSFAAKIAVFITFYSVFHLQSNVK